MLHDGEAACDELGVSDELLWVGALVEVVRFYNFVVSTDAVNGEIPVLGSHICPMRAIDDSRMRAEPGRPSEEAHLVGGWGDGDLNPQRREGLGGPEPCAVGDDGRSNRTTLSPDSGDPVAFGDDGVDRHILYDRGTERLRAVGECGRCR